MIQKNVIRFCFLVLLVCAQTLFLSPDCFPQYHFDEPGTEWKQAIALKRQLDENQNISSDVRNRFNEWFNRILAKNKILTDKGTDIINQSNSYEENSNAYRNELATFTSSCASHPVAGSEYRHCIAWKDSLDQWKANLDRIRSSIEQLKEAYNSDIKQLITDETVPFNKELAKALSPKERTWVFTSSSGNKTQEATVTVKATGTFSQTDADQQKWYVFVPGCADSTYPLIIKNGTFSGRNVNFTIEGKGCGGRSRISGSGSGSTDLPFPDSNHAWGYITGEITDPLTEMSIDSADSIAGLRNIVGGIIQGDDFDKAVLGKSLIEAKYAIKKMLPRRMDRTQWEASPRTN